MTRVLERMLGAQGDPTDMEPHGAQELWTVDMARLAWANHRAANGLTAVAYPLLTPPDGNYKLAKSATPTYGLALAQAATSGFNVCPSSTPECRKHCVASAGKGTLDRVKRVRVVRTTFLAAIPQAFLRLLVDEIDRAVRKHGKVNVRLNTFSDLPWETIAPWLFTRWGDAVAFYDYTKVWSRVTPANYVLTLSATEHTERSAVYDACRGGHAVAVVVNVKRGAPMPEWFNLAHDNSTDAGWVRMIDGDLTDDRTLDTVDMGDGRRMGRVVALRPKGTMSGKGSPVEYAASGRSGMVFEV